MWMLYAKIPMLQCKRYWWKMLEHDIPYWVRSCWADDSADRVPTFTLSYGCPMSVHTQRIWACIDRQLRSRFSSSAYTTRNSKYVNRWRMAAGGFTCVLSSEGQEVRCARWPLQLWHQYRLALGHTFFARLIWVMFYIPWHEFAISYIAWS